MAARLGNVLYWLGCGVAVNCALLVLIVYLGPGEEAVFFGLVYAACGIGAWLFGRACRYVLSGN
jgi:hypothetical protein